MKTFKKLTAVLLFFGFILNSNAQCNAKFNYRIKGSDTLQMVNLATPNSGLSYMWIAPGLEIINGTETSANPIFRAWIRGHYKIRLIVTDKSSNCSDTITEEVTIRTPNWCSTVIADFKDSIINKTLHLTEQCTPEIDTTLDYTRWLIFDDFNAKYFINRAIPLNKSGEKTKSVQFSAPRDGLYGAYLFYYDVSQKCYDSLIKVVELQQVQKPCRAGFNIENTSAENYILKDSSFVMDMRNSIRHWDFGDGDSATYPFTMLTSYHKFTKPGTYNIRLIVEDTLNRCMDTAYQSIQITKSCIAFFNPQNSSTLTAGFHEFSFVANRSNTSFSWSFGDGNFGFGRALGNTYSTKGTYTVCLDVNDTLAKCKDTICKPVSVGVTLNKRCDAGFRASQDLKGNVEFQSTLYYSTNPDIKYLWVFEDLTTSTLPNPKRSYPLSGKYPICLSIENTKTGCRDTTCSNIYIGTGYAGCKADYSFSTNNLNASFVNLSPNPTSNIEYLWVFDDGDTSTQVNPNHTYSNYGVYNVCLIRLDTLSKCIDTACKSISFVAPPKCSASFTDSSITNTYVQFKNTSHINGSNPNYIWDFGDVFNVNSFVKNPLYLYLNTGVFNVCLYIEDSTFAGICRDTVCQNININYNQLGVAESSTGKSYSIYPNPSNGVFNLDWKTEGENNSIIVYNSSGVMIKSVDEMDPNSYEKTIDLSDFPDGMYLIQLHGDSSVESVRVIKSN